MGPLLRPNCADLVAMVPELYSIGSILVQLGSKLK